MTLPAIFKLKHSFLFVPRTINWNFPGLALREIILNLSITLLRSLLRLIKARSKLLSPQKRVLSSPNLHTFDFFMEKNKSLINILNKRGTKIDPCGTPILISHQELNDEPIFVCCFQQVR